MSLWINSFWNLWIGCYLVSRVFSHLRRRPANYFPERICIRGLWTSGHQAVKGGGLLLKIVESRKHVQGEGWDPCVVTFWGCCRLGFCSPGRKPGWEVRDIFLGIWWAYKKRSKYSDLRVFQGNILARSSKCEVQSFKNPHTRSELSVRLLVTHS